MNVVRWNPFREIEDILGRYSLLNDGFPVNAGSNGEGVSDWRPAVDISEKADGYVFTVDLPAVDPKDVELSVREGVLVIKGERQSEARKDDEQVHRIERRYGRFLRSFHLPEDADPENVSARARNGVLEVTVAKRAQVMPRRIEIQAA